MLHFYAYICGLRESPLQGESLPCPTQLIGERSCPPAGNKPSKANGEDWRLGSTGNHQVALACPDVVGGGDEGIVGGGAGSGD